MGAASIIGKVEGVVEPLGVWHMPGAKNSSAQVGAWGTEEKPLARKHLVDLHTYLDQISGGTQGASPATGKDQLVTRARLIAQERVDQMARGGKYVALLPSTLRRPVMFGGVVDGIGMMQARDWGEMSPDDLKRDSLFQFNLFTRRKALRVTERREVNGKLVDGVRRIYLTQEAASSVEKRLFAIALLKERAAGPVQVKYEQAGAAQSPFAKLIDQLVETINVKRKAESLDAWKQGQQEVLDAQKNKAKGGLWEQLMGTLRL